MSDNSPRGAELLGLKRRAFLLDQLNSEPEGKLTQARANKKITAALRKALTISDATANDLRDGLESLGLLAKHKRGRSVTYSITAAGRDWIAAHREHLPALPPKPAPGVKREPKPKPEPTAVVQVPIQESREAVLLLHLLDGPDEGRTASDLSKQAGSKNLKLADAAGHALSGLAGRQLILVTHLPRSDKYKLTPAGRAHLFTLAVDGAVKVTLSGSALTKLLQAGRPGPSPELACNPTPALTTGQLEAVVSEAFAGLRRERYAATGLVPIHEVRSAVRRQFGDAAASHAVFDDVLLGMRRAKKVGLLSISDRGRATEAQLRDSVGGVGETFFYLVGVDDTASG